MRWIAVCRPPSSVKITSRLHPSEPWRSRGITNPFFCADQPILRPPRLTRSRASASWSDSEPDGAAPSAAGASFEGASAAPSVAGAPSDGEADSAGAELDSVVAGPGVEPPQASVNRERHVAARARMLDKRAGAALL